jgi:hypothetical protein
VNNYVKVWMNSAKNNPYVYYTPKYLAMAQPASLLQHTANAAFYTLLASKRVLDSSNSMLYNCWARNQIGYMLGDSGHSYVTGYGAGAPLKTPHKAASCPPVDVGDCNAEVRGPAGLGGAREGGRGEGGLGALLGSCQRAESLRAQRFLMGTASPGRAPASLPADGLLHDRPQLQPPAWWPGGRARCARPLGGCA